MVPDWWGTMGKLENADFGAKNADFGAKNADFHCRIGGSPEIHPPEW